MREREHQPTDTDGDQNEREEGPHGVANAFAEFALGQERERDGNTEREDQHGLEMIQHFVFAHLMNFFGASHLTDRERSRRRKFRSRYTLKFKRDCAGRFRTLPK